MYSVSIAVAAEKKKEIKSHLFLVGLPEFSPSFENFFLQTSMAKRQRLFDSLFIILKVVKLLVFFHVFSSQELSFFSYLDIVNVLGIDNSLGSVACAFKIQHYLLFLLLLITSTSFVCLNFQVKMVNMEVVDFCSIIV